MATLSSKRTALVELDPAFGFIKPRERHRGEKTGDDPAVQLYLPLRSQRMELEEQNQKSYLHPSNQRHLRKLVENDLFVKYNRAEKIVRTKLLRSQLEKWSAATMYQRRELKSVRRLMPEVMQLNIPDQWFYRRGLQTIYAFLWYAQQRKVKSSFYKWKYRTDANRNRLATTFSRWSWKTSAWKLNKMKARDFIKRTANLVRRVQIAHWQYYYQRWLDFTAKMQMLVKMRLLFRCWKTTVHALKATRRRAVQRAFLYLRQLAANRHRRASRIRASRQKRVQLWVLHGWLLAWKRKRVLLRLFAQGGRVELIRAISKWKTVLQHKNIMPRLSQSVSQSFEYLSPRKDAVHVSQRAVFQSGDKLVYRSISSARRSCSGCGRVPAAESQASHTTSLLSSSLRERVAWRLQAVKDLDRSFAQHEEIARPMCMGDEPPPSVRPSYDQVLPYRSHLFKPDLTAQQARPRPEVQATPARTPATPASSRKASPAPRPSHLYGGVIGGGPSTPQSRGRPSRPASASTTSRTPTTQSTPRQPQPQQSRQVKTPARPSTGR